MVSRKIIKMAALFPVACTWGVTQAQSSVTIYGVADVNIEVVNHLSSQVPSSTNGFSTGPGHSLFRMSSGGLSGSRFGIRGVEALGSETNAVFVLENGFGIDGGALQQGGRLFGRQGFVGLDNKSYGRLTFGRQYTSIFDLLANFSPSIYSTQYEPTVFLVGLNFRSDNTVKYSNKFGPIDLVAHWSFGNGASGAGEVPGQFRRDTGHGTGAAYASGPIGFTVAYDQFNPTLNATTGAAGTVKKAAIAASYTYESAKIMGGYRWGHSKGASGTTVLRDDYLWLGVNYRLLPSLDFTLQYDYDNVRNFAGDTGLPNPWQIGLIVNYFLSKRTDIYFTTAYAKNSGLNFDSSAINFANGYFLGAGHSTMLGAALGMRHRF